MTPVFADTYYCLALINPRDQAHAEALALSQSLTQPVVTTAWVLAEVGDAMARPPNRSTFVQLLKDVAQDSETTVVPADQSQFDAWSLTDCISFQVMQDRGLTEALTSDHHFCAGRVHHSYEMIVRPVRAGPRLASRSPGRPRRDMIG